MGGLTSGADGFERGHRRVTRRSCLAKRLKAARKTLGILEVHGPRHPGLQSHEYSTLRGTRGEDVWESYVEQRTPAAYRIFWHYGPADGEITVLAITSHP
jgi:hypothetical protein